MCYLHLFASWDLSAASYFNTVNEFRVRKGALNNPLWEVSYQSNGSRSLTVNVVLQVWEKKKKNPYVPLCSQHFNYVIMWSKFGGFNFTSFCWGWKPGNHYRYFRTLLGYFRKWYLNTMHILSIVPTLSLGSFSLTLYWSSFTVI